MDFQPQFHRSDVSNMMEEFEYEEDDDVFYSELRRQVLQLTAEDDQDQKVSDLKNPDEITTWRTDNGGCYNLTGSKEDQTTRPVGWRGGNAGTGVFIPQVAQPGMKSRPRKKRNARRKTKTEA